MTSSALEKYVIDNDRVLSDGTSSKGIVYLVAVALIDESKLIPMYIGRCGAGSHRHLRDMVRRWVGDHCDIWAGISPDKIRTGKVKLQMRKLFESDNLNELKAVKAAAIKRYQPYLQSTPFPKYPSIYQGVDLCILPSHRTEAFSLSWHKLRKPKRLIDCILLDPAFKPDWVKAKIGKGNPLVECRLKQELKIGTQEYKIIKKKIDEGLGLVVDGRRGATYPFIIRLLSNVLFSADTAQ